MGARTNWTREEALTYLANTYSADGYIADKIFKPIPIKRTKAKVPEWAKDSLRIPSKTIRPRGGNAVQVTRGEVTWTDITTDFHAIKDIIDIQDMEEFTDADLGDSKAELTEVLTNMLWNAHEKEVADIVQDPDNYSSTSKATLSGSDQLTHADSDFYTMSEDAKSTIRGKVFRIPNTLILPYDVKKALKSNVNLLAKLGTNRSNHLSDDDLKEILGYKYILDAEGQWVDEDGTSHDFWSDKVMIGYIPEKGQKREVAPGYTFKKKSGIFVKSWTSDDGNITTVQAEQRKKPVALQMDCMFLYSDALE